MLDFRPLELFDMNRLRSCFGKSYDSDATPRRICDYVPGTVMMWRGYFSTEAAWVNDTVVLRAIYYDGKPFYSFPVGKDPVGALNLMSRESRGKHIRFCFIDRSDVEVLDDVMGIESAEPCRDMFDYIYIKSELEAMSGRRFHRMKNLANRFESLYNNYEYYSISEENALSLIPFVTRFGENEDPMLAAEAQAECEILKNWDIFGFSGGFINVGNKTAAITLGEIHGDTLYVHTEKGDRNFPGVYQVIQRDYLRSVKDKNIIYVNREEDLGIPGLRQAKLSYNPAFFGEKYTVVCKNTSDSALDIGKESKACGICV